MHGSRAGEPCCLNLARSHGPSNTLRSRQLARSNAAPVTRRSFSRLKNPLEVPHLIDIQRRSFEALTDPKTGHLRETIDDISPIEDYTGNLAIVFGEFRFEEAPNTVAECREKDMT